VTTACPGALPLPCFAFEDAIEAVREGRAGRAMIPIENSLHGRVADIHFLLPESGLAIIGEHFMPIRYTLMGGGDVRLREAVSHPQRWPVPTLVRRGDPAGQLSRHGGGSRAGC
jgi:prephenate dehydratase